MYGVLGPHVLTACSVVTAARCLRASAIYIACLQKVMDVLVIAVGPARCVVTALLYAFRVTSTQMRSRTVQIV